MDWLAEEIDESPEVVRKTWKLLIVDDDEEVHKVTRLSIADFIFEGRKIESVSVYTGDEAKAYLSSNNDVAVVFLDVVMESDDAGLTVSKYIRDELHNHFTRVLLRTGQPGFAPIRDVMRDYDIDGYIAKTESSKQNLNHALYIALRSYRDLVRIQHYQQGLEAIINAITNLTQIDEVLDLAKAIIGQLSHVLGADEAEFMVQGADIFALTQNENESCQILVNDHQSKVIKNAHELNEHGEFVQLTDRALADKKSFYEPPYYINYYCSQRGTETIFLLRTEEVLNKESQKLLNIFSIQFVLTLENLIRK